MTLTGANSFTVKADTVGLDQFFEKLGGEAEDAVRPAAQVGIQVIYDRVKLNVAALGRKTGNLDSSIYQVYSKANSQTGQRATYQVSWNHKKAPHGHLVEYGYFQRYRYYRGGDGGIRPMVRPGMDGQPRPGRKASQAQKDAYYVTLPAPRHVPGKAFVRSAQSVFAEAYQAAEQELIRRLLEKQTW